MAVVVVVGLEAVTKKKIQQSPKLSCDIAVFFFYSNKSFSCDTDD